MDVIPAVDIMKGKVVRLLRGDPKFTKSYEHLGNPVALAKRWEDEGAKIIHIIDLDATFGQESNMSVIKEIIKAVKVSVQVGGGVRNLDTAQVLLNSGVARVLLGSLAFKEPSTIQVLLNEFGGNRIIVALDNLDGVVMIHGWKISTKICVYNAISKFLELGVSRFLVTSVERDGTLQGPDFETLAKICHMGADVTAAGGIRSLDDIVALKRLNVNEVVVGKALYEGVFTLGEALRIVKT